MIPIRLFLAFVLPVLAAGCAGHRQDAALTRIAFGSCINTNTHPMLERVVRTDFDLFILLGDNIYADTTNAVVMQRKYAALKNSPFFRRLREKAPVLATWDDHDYGENDAGAEYPMKVESQRLFLDFIDEPLDSPRRRHEGVYDARVFGPPGKRVQVILLDVRYFRSMLSTGVNNVVPSGGKYVPNPDPNATMLGEAQWNWLEEQLRIPAEVRIIGTGIQFISEFSGGEAWANLPREKQRMLDLLAKTRANGVIFISGDRHWAELSRLDRPGGYPLYDLTSSALTQKHPRGTPTPNKYRADPRTYHDANLGLIRIHWKEHGPSVTLQLLDVNGRVRIEQRIDRLTR
jgi:alkaline phosphatase D